MKSRAKFVTVGTILSTLALATFATPAHADDDPLPNLPPVGSTDTVGSYVNGRQNQLMDLKSWILSQPGLADSGYIESVNDSASLSTTLLWSGQENGLQKSIIAEGERRGITVKVEYRKFSGAQLDHAATKIASLGHNAIKGFRWTAILTITPDFDGIRMQGTATGASVAEKNNASSVASKAVTAAIAADAAELAGVDVKVDTGIDVKMAATHRWDDNTPFNAGGFLNSKATRSGCSTGFSVRVGGIPYAMTARHCVAHDYQTISGNRSYGDGVRNSADGAARQMSVSGSPFMFDGSWNDSSGFKKKVIGYGDVSSGDRVCTSGANSGVHCGITIQAMGVRIDDGYPYVSDPSFSAILGQNATLGGTANCEGDSGGPVLTPRDTANVLAVGMIQAIPVYAPWDTSPSTRFPAACSRGVYFTSMRTIVNTLPNASLVTG